MGVTTTQQNQPVDKQSSKDLYQGGRRSSRSGSSSNSHTSSQPSRTSANKKTPPSKFASQLRKLRKRSSNNNNNQTVQNPSSSRGKEEKKARNHAEGDETKTKNVERTPEVKRKHQKTDSRGVDEDQTSDQQKNNNRLDGLMQQGKNDNKTDLKQCSTSSSNSNKTLTSSRTSNGTNNIKNRPPVKLTVKFNKSEGGGKKPCQVHVVNSSLSVLPTISSRPSSSSATNNESTPTISTPSKINDTSAGTSIDRTIEGR